jgi:hypothetical protein
LGFGSKKEHIIENSNLNSLIVNGGSLKKESIDRRKYSQGNTKEKEKMES